MFCICLYGDEDFGNKRIGSVVDALFVGKHPVYANCFGIILPARHDVIVVKGRVSNSVHILAYFIERSSHGSSLHTRFSHDAKAFHDHSFHFFLTAGIRVPHIRIYGCVTSSNIFPDLYLDSINILNLLDRQGSDGIVFIDDEYKAILTDSSGN